LLLEPGRLLLDGLILPDMKRPSSRAKSTVGGGLLPDDEEAELREGVDGVAGKSGDVPSAAEDAIAAVTRSACSEAAIDD
jgi:hypothetical protein